VPFGPELWSSEIASGSAGAGLATGAGGGEGDGSGEGAIAVRRVAVDNGEGGVLLRDYPKTAAGFRTVRIGRAVADALRAFLERRDARRLRLAAAGRGAAWEENDLVFASRHGTVRLRANVERVFKRHCRDAGVGDGHPHLMRHTFASHLFKVGRPVTEISYLLGHSSRAVTMDVYGHFLEDGHVGAAGALAASYGSASAANDPALAAELAALVARVAAVSGAKRRSGGQKGRPREATAHETAHDGP